MLRIRISRRTLLRAGVLAIGTPLMGYGRQAPHHAALTAYRMRALSSASPGAVAIGSAYLELRPELASTERLVGALTDRMRHGYWTALTSDDRGLRRHLRRMIEDDFASGRVVTLRGWVVSDTEAQLAALVLVH